MLLNKKKKTYSKIIKFKNKKIITYGFLIVSKFNIFFDSFNDLFIKTPNFRFNLKLPKFLYSRNLLFFSKKNKKACYSPGFFIFDLLIFHFWNSSSFSIMSKKMFSLYHSWSNNIRHLLFYSLYGQTNNLQILGYSRRAWFSPLQKNLLCFKVGFSFLRKFLIPKMVCVRLVNARFFTIYSPSKKNLTNFCLKIFSLKPTTPFKEMGIVYQQKPVKMKKKKSSL